MVTVKAPREMIETPKRNIPKIENLTRLLKYNVTLPPEGFCSDEEIVKQVLLRKPNLRKVFLIIVSLCPCRASNVKDKIPTVSRDSIYDHLNKLKSLGLIYRIPVARCFMGEKLNAVEKVVKQKFILWSGQMSDFQKENYQLKTGYWYPTSFGEELIKWVCKNEQGVNFAEKDNLMSHTRG